MLSIIIPARNEKYLNNTILDIFQKATTKPEIIVVLDGYWETPVDGVIYIHFGKAVGMRTAINSAVAIAKGKYIMKLDAHCMLDVGFDEKLLSAHESGMIQIPTRKRLNPEKWEIINDGRPDINYMKLNSEYRGIPDDKKNKDKKLAEKKIDDIESFQGSCWFMTRWWYRKLRLLDAKNFGEMGHEAQEIRMKCLARRGRVVVNKNTWYAHWHKEKSDINFTPDRKKSRKYIKDFMKRHVEVLGQTICTT